MKILRAVAMASMFLAGCGGTPTTPGPNPQPTVTPTPSPTPTPVPTPIPVVNQFVRADGDLLRLENGQEYKVKGAVYWYQPYHNQYPIRYTFEQANIPHYMFQDFNETEIDKNLARLKSDMNINTVRIMTPGYNFAKLTQPDYNFPDWYLADGSMNPTYLDKIDRFVQIAKRNDLKVSLLIALNAFTDWECPDLVGWSFIYPNLPNSSCRFVAPGTELETKYFNHARSIATRFKNEGGIFDYEISGENLLRWQLNGQGMHGNHWYEARMASFVRRFADEMRRYDDKHLITSGEVTNYDTAHPGWWAYPSPEFGFVDDIDQLNGGERYTLESILDYVSPHMYTYQANNSWIKNATNYMLSLTEKPLVMGEFGYMAPNADPLALPASIDNRLWVLRKFVDLQTRTSGGFVWNPLPQFPIPTADNYRTEPVSATDPRRYSVILYPNMRRIWGADMTFTLYTNDSASRDGIVPLPEGQNLFPE